MAQNGYGLYYCLVAIALLWYLMRGCNKEAATAVTTDTAVATPAAPEPVVAAPVARESFK
jgi:hypothetical protein